MSGRQRVLFVCMGNICRSPAAEGVLLQRLADERLDGLVEVDSAGTIAYHTGDPADARMARAASRRGYRLPSRARQVTAQDFERFDLIVAMDRDNYRDLEELAAGEPGGSPAGARLKLLSDYLPAGSPTDVPDPYYGGDAGFERVLDLLEAACPALLAELSAELERN